jgi:histidyl-tRNA synthetase
VTIAKRVRVFLTGGASAAPSTTTTPGAASGARYALVFGDDELARGEVALKPLRAADAVQRSLPLAEADRWGAELLNA